MRLRVMLYCQSLLQRAYLKQGAKLMGIAVSQEQIKQVIVDDPNFMMLPVNSARYLLKKYLDSTQDDRRDQFV